MKANTVILLSLPEWDNHTCIRPTYCYTKEDLRPIYTSKFAPFVKLYKNLMVICYSCEPITDIAKSWTMFNFHSYIAREKIGSVWTGLERLRSRIPKYLLAILTQFSRKIKVNFKTIESSIILRQLQYFSPKLLQDYYRTGGRVYIKGTSWSWLQGKLYLLFVCRPRRVRYKEQSLNFKWSFW